MKKTLTAIALVLSLVLALAACAGGTANTNSDTTPNNDTAPATSDTEKEAPAETTDNTPAESTPADNTPAETSGEAAEIDVGGPYPATTNWDEYVIMPYYFAETDETLDMLVETNDAHDKYEILFTFFGDKQDMVFSVNGEEVTVDYDLTGFMGKDAQNIYNAIKENVTEWYPVSGGAVTAEIKEIDVGGPYPATTNWDEYVFAPYYFAETDETLDLLVETNEAHDKFEVLFNFFGDKQDLVFSVNGGEVTVDSDLTGFMGKDAQNIYNFIQENVTDWTKIG